MKLFAALNLLISSSSVAYALNNVVTPGGHNIPDNCILQVSSKELVSAHHIGLKALESCKGNKEGFGFGSQQIYAQDVHLQNTGLWKNFTGDWVGECD